MTRLLLVAVLLALTACSANAGAHSEEVVVFAASSLTEPYTRLAREFEAGHPGVTITLNFGASSSLARSIVAGAPADVFAAANPSTMDTVQQVGLARSPVRFAQNTLQIAVPAQNPGRVRKLADLADPRLTVALCAPEVPCGAAARTALDAARVRVEPDTLELDAKATIAKVVLGEVDAALVYRTDVRAAGAKVRGIDFPEAAKAVNDYLLTALDDTATARAFVEYVTGPKGQDALRAAGFTVP